jgi:hypothetical protein
MSWAEWRRGEVPLSVKKLVYPDGHKAGLYRSRLKRFRGRNFEALDPLEWLARMSDQIPDPGQPPHAVLRRALESRQRCY